MNNTIHFFLHIVQKIAQVPGRGEPDSDGEINFKHVLATLDGHGYQVIYNILYTYYIYSTRYVSYILVLNAALNGHGD